MSIYKDPKLGTWYVSVRYTDWNGKRKQKLKRGFPTKREAQAWEREFVLKEQSNLDMTFGSFYKLYEAERQRDGCIDYHHQYFDGKEEDDPLYIYYAESSSYDETRKIYEDINLLCDSYLAIILSRKNPDIYSNIINGLLNRWHEERWKFVTKNGEYNPYFALRFPREDENTEMEIFSYITKDEYLKKLINCSQFSAHHRFGFITSLAIIINFEQEMMDEYQSLKWYRKVIPPLGRIVKRNEQQIKQKKLELYVKKHKNNVK